MKNFITKSALIFAVTGASFAMASDNGTTIEDQEYRVVQLSDLPQDEVDNFCQAKMEGVVLSIEGTTLSFSVSLDSNLFDAEKHIPRKVKIMKPCFIKCEKGVHYFSSNFKDWIPFKDFFDHNLDASFHIDEETYLVNINLHVNLNQKD